jgi:hypothetical protein
MVIFSVTKLEELSGNGSVISDEVTSRLRRSSLDGKRT